jgi:amino acid adenylation domain-containing protein
MFQIFLEEKGVEACHSLKRVICGGEALSIASMERFFERLPGELHNYYGPTETSIGSIDWTCQREYSRRVVPIGRPIANTKIYLLDAHLRPVPTGVPGELYTGGFGLARGYLNRPELTAEKFIPDPFGARPGARLYRSGDVARYLPDGNIEFLGRIDYQVKIRGLRLELGEIESVLAQHGSVLDVIVIMREDVPGDKRLVAYVVPQPFAFVTGADLRAFLKEKLPDYMIPSAFVMLDEMPLTLNIKIDRNALPAPDTARPEISGEYAAPRKPAEEILASIWTDVLGVERVGIHDNFFELGGHSLLATQVMSRVREVFRLELPLRRLFELPTVAELAQNIEQEKSEDNLDDTTVILPVPRDEELPLSFAQQRLWFLDQLEPGSAFYNVPAAVRLKGRLDISALGRTFSEIMRRHEVLRTSFRMQRGEAVQVVAQPERAQLLEMDLRELPLQEREPAAQRLAHEEASRPFNLASGPLLRLTLLRLDTDDHVLLLTMHHIISDGWSIGVLVGEVAALYQAYSEGKESPLTELKVQYADYAVWQRRWLQGTVLDRQLEYWRAQLQGLASLSLPTDHTRPPVQSYRGAQHHFTLDAKVTEHLRRASSREGVTLFMMLLAAFQILLSRYSGQEDVAVGTAIAGRNRREVEGLIGFFVNTLVLRTEVNGGWTVRQFIERVREVCLGAYAHQDVPFEKLVEELQPERDLSRSPLFQVMFNLQNVPQRSLEITGLTLSSIGGDTKTAKLDLGLSMIEGEDGLAGELEYNTDLFEAATVERMMFHLQNLLAGMWADTEQRVGHIPMLSDAERHQLLVQWNQTASDYPRHTSIHQLFEQQATRTPETVALVYREQRLSYRELNERANRLAHYLRSRGVGPETLVGLCLERGPLMIVGLLGALKAGAAYLPLDIAYPGERLSFMLSDAQATMLLTTTQQYLDNMRAPDNLRVVQLDTEWEAIAKESAENPRVEMSAENLAYVIYTSGSTGRPKGVAVEHKGLSNLATAQARAFGVKAGSRVLQFASLSFDASFSEIFMALTTGATLFLTERETLPSIPALVQLLNRQSIDTATLPPAILALLDSDGLPALKNLIAAGAACPAEIAERWSVGRHFFNAYGPTEASVCATLTQCEGAFTEEPPIGRPMANVQVYLLDSNLQAIPTGVTGEIHIAGAGLARGYLNQPALTAEKFIPHPFGTEPGARLYRTGDLGRYLPDGQIKFLGRQDEQVKIRGYRIEPVEIEAVLRQCSQLTDCFVVARPAADGELRLVAYLVAAPGPALTINELRTHLQTQLPDYMIPAQFVFLSELPLMPNGKVDHRSLPAPEQVRPEVENYVAARTPVEQLLTDIWSDLLNLEAVGVKDNFFALGGHSLLATRLVNRLREVFSIDVPLRRLFEAPDISGLACVVNQSLQLEECLEAPPILPASREHPLPLSFAQQRLWFLDQLEPGSAFYNIPAAVRLNGELNIAALEETLREIVRRHEVLRTSFASDGGMAVQIIDEAPLMRLALTDLSELEAGQREPQAMRILREEAERGFDLREGQLMRVRLLKLGATEHLLALNMHHIVSDGWSMGVLITEVSRLYSGYSRGEEGVLEELEIQYGDFAVWQREWFQGEALERELKYWRQQLDGSPTLDVPTDRPHPAVQSHSGAHHSFALDHTVSRRLKELSQREGVTLYMTLLAGFQLLLSRYTGQTDIIVGTDIANRNRAETERLIGFFVNQLVMRTDLSGKPNFIELLKRVREVCLGAYAHQDMPFEKLVEELQPERDLSRSPLFQVKLILQNAPNQELRLSGLELSPLELTGRTTKLDLTLAMIERADGAIGGTIEYNTDLFDAATVERMAKHFARLLEEAGRASERPITELEMLSEEERWRLLVQWNDTAREYPHDSCLHQLFESQVERTPEATAVIFQDQKLSYRELNERANQLAHYLQTMGVGAEVLVGLCMERSPWMIVGLLGVLKAGGAYVPLDPQNPLERLSFMLEDAGVSVLLTQGHLVDQLPVHMGQVIAVDADWSSIARESSDNPKSQTSAENLAYVIYTSGSTGAPKGVLVQHRGLVNYLTWAVRHYAPEDGSGSPLHSSISFDLAVTSIYAPLLSGRSVDILTEREHVLALTSALKQRAGYSLLKLTPTHLQLLNDQLTPEELKGRSRVIILGGENLLSTTTRYWREHAPQTRLYNEYGPTETVVGSCIYEVGERESENVSVPIGKPIVNTEIYILNSHQHPAPVGVAGEIYIGGAGVTRGYLNQPALTAEKFIPHPFSTEPGARLYRTGDLARYLPDGNMEFLGRVDHQVKLRGFRVELGEVEAVMAEHACIREAVLVLHEDSTGEKRLAAYVAAREPLSISELREFLKRRLPEYMVPSAFIMMEALPLTPSGKVDRRALPGPDATLAEPLETFVPPRNTLEFQLAQVWEEVLMVQPIGVTDNFFELGGHSLSAVHMMARIRQLFGCDLPLNTLFQGGTIEMLAALLRQRADSLSASTLVGIQTSGSKRPFFCVHPAGGNIICYISLARRLGPDQPLYGLQSPGLNGSQEPLQSIEEMATRYLEAVRSVQPSGPYLLGGWSFGGALAFEMARQLESQGEEIALLALLDSRAPVSLRDDVELDDATLLASIAADAELPVSEEELRQLEPDERLRYFLDQGRSRCVVPADYDLEQARRLLCVYKNNVKALNHYSPQGSVRKVTLFRASEESEAGTGPASETSSPDATLGWSRFSSEPVDVYYVPGNHLDMLTVPRVQSLADVLSRSLEEAQLAASKIER